MFPSSFLQEENSDTFHKGPYKEDSTVILKVNNLIVHFVLFCLSGFVLLYVMAKFISFL